MESATCPNCYRKISSNAKFCVSCGAAQADRKVSGPNIDRRSLRTTDLMLGIIALLLAVICYKLFTSFSGTQIAEVIDYMPVQDSAEPDNKFEKGPYYDSLMQSNKIKMSLGEKERYALFNEREMVINRSLPQLLGPTLKLLDVNYKHSSNEMDYKLQAITSDFNIPNSKILDKMLQSRYCQSNEFAAHRNNRVTVNWIYWSRSGIVLHKYSSSPCSNGSR
mgnify:CR=1 FL=1